MPIIHYSNQGNSTLEEIYQELTTEKHSAHFTMVGKSMLPLLELINQTFTDTTLYGLTSHYNLIILKTDSWKCANLVSIECNGDDTFEIRYPMPERLSHWLDADISGQANTVEQALDYLIIAMTESQGWEDSQELKEVYTMLQVRLAQASKFSLRLEFEDLPQNDSEIGKEFCTIHIELEDGRQYKLTAWTFKFFHMVFSSITDLQKRIDIQYKKRPDLLIDELTSSSITPIIRDLLRQGDLEKALKASYYTKLIESLPIARELLRQDDRDKSLNASIHTKLIEGIIKIKNKLLS